jgi:DNA-binding CsgD family transcriptional regulator
MLTMVDVPADLVTVADFDCDGGLEYVLGRYSSRELEIYTELETDPRLQAKAMLPSMPVALNSGDFDGDGRPELVVGLLDGRIELYAASPGLAFNLKGTVILPAPPSDLEVCCSDGMPPVVVAALSSSVHVLSSAGHEPNLPAVAPAVQESVERLAVQKQRTPQDVLLKHAQITIREKEVMDLALEGMSARDIGTTLFIGERTVESHLAHAYSKLGVRSRFELLLRAARSSPQDR